jgi:hypothetical protein
MKRVSYEDITLAGATSRSVSTIFFAETSRDLYMRPQPLACSFSKCLKRKEHLENELQRSMILAERIQPNRVRTPRHIRSN